MGLYNHQQHLRGYLKPENTKVSCGKWPQYLISPRKAIQYPYLGSSCNSSLWPKVTRFNKSQRGYLQLEDAVVHYGQRPQYLRRKSDVYKCNILL